MINRGNVWTGFGAESKRHGHGTFDKLPWILSEDFSDDVTVNRVPSAAAEWPQLKWGSGTGVVLNMSHCQITRGTRFAREVVTRLLNLTLTLTQEINKHLRTRLRDRARATARMRVIWHCEVFDTTPDGDSSLSMDWPAERMTLMRGMNDRTTDGSSTTWRRR